MPIPIEQHPNYGAAMQAYQTARTVAIEAGDVAAQQKADLEWANTRSTMQNEMFDRGQAEQARSAAVAEAKALVPGIPDSLLARLTDPADILATAQEMRAQADAQPPQGQAPATGPQGGPAPAVPAPSWGGGAPTGPGTVAPDPNSPREYQGHLRELAQQVETNVGRSPAAQEEFGKTFFTGHILPQMIRPELYKQVTGHDTVRVGSEVIKER